MHHFFALINRLGLIRRWSLMRNTRSENVQEHSHAVAVIAHALAVIRRDVFGVPCDPGLAAAAALYHDAPEIYTGDLPTPVKYSDGDIAAAYRHVEEAAKDRLLATLPETLRPAYAPLVRETYGDELRALVKAADTLSAHIKCLEELKSGNLEFRRAAEQTRVKLAAIELPEVRYFVEHFLASFELTLDEQE